MIRLEPRNPVETFQPRFSAWTAVERQCGQTIWPPVLIGVLIGAKCFMAL